MAFSIRKKLLVGFSVVTLAVVGMGGYVVTSIQAMNTLNAQMYDGVVMTSTYAQSARANFLKASKVGREAGGAEAEKAFLEDLAVVKERAPERQSSAMVDEIKQLHGRWAAGGAADKELAAQIEERLTALTDRAAEVGFEFKHTSASLGTRTLYVGYGVTGAALLISVGVWLVLTRHLVPPLRAMIEQLDDLVRGEGDLTRRLAVNSRDELGDLAERFNRFLAWLDGIVVQVRSGATDVVGAARQLAAASDELSGGAQRHAAGLEETAANLEEMTATVKQNAESARHAKELTRASHESAERGRLAVTSTISSMQEMTNASKKMAEIITVIDEIAFQTNLLALNAAVESARAGEHGRGFAVVSAEVRALAQRSAGAAREIKALIADSVNKVTMSGALVDNSGHALVEIVASVERFTSIVSEIANASHEQSLGIDQVTRAVSLMDQVVQQNATQTEDVASTAAALAASAQQLEALVGRFRVTERAPAPGPRTPRASLSAGSLVAPVHDRHGFAAVT
jgi:methyl-accepting chemotaxis protein